MDAPVSSAIAVQDARLPPAMTDSESDDRRWRQWKRQGRDDDARFRRRLRMVLANVAGVAALGGALWFASVTWL